MTNRGSTSVRDESTLISDWVETLHSVFRTSVLTPGLTQSRVHEELIKSGRPG
jgi:hypothetical protein